MSKNKSSIIKKAKALGKKLPDGSIFGAVFKNNPNNIERVLFEIAQQANSSKVSKETTIRAVGSSLVDLALKLFPDVTINDTFNDSEK